MSCYSAFGQNLPEPDSLVVSATILDKESSEPIPYATIYNQTTGKGTISKFTGYFSLDGISVNDTLIISSIGYEKKYIIVTLSSILNPVIYLPSKTELLNEVTILADNSFLYDLIKKTKKLISPKIPKHITYLNQWWAISK